MRAQQKFRYEGAAATLVSLNVLLEGEVINAPSPSTPLSADVVVVLGDDLQFSTSQGTHAATLLYETIPFSPELDLLAHGRLELGETVSPQVVTAELVLNLSPADEFFVWAEMFAFAGHGQTVDALNAMSIVFSDASGIVPVYGPDGDFNADGTIDAADYVVWRKNRGSPEDYDNWRGNFGANFAASIGIDQARTAGLPEPPSFVFVLTVAYFGLIWRLSFRRPKLG